MKTKKKSISVTNMNKILALQLYYAVLNKIKSRVSHNIQKTKMLDFEDNIKVDYIN